MGAHEFGILTVRSGMGGCRLGVPMKENDKFWLTANYDFAKHEGEYYHENQVNSITNNYYSSKTESGDLDEVMGVGVVLLVT